MWALVEVVCALLYGSAVKPEAQRFIRQMRRPERTEGAFIGSILPHPYTLYFPAPDLVSIDGTLQHDSRGFRGPEVAVPKPDGVYRIVCLGGSTTYGAFVHDPMAAYPMQLRETLRKRQGTDRLEVVNAGIVYATSAETLGTFALRGLELEPDMIVLNMGGNDIEPFLAPDYRPDYRHWRKNWTLPRSSLPLRLALQSPTIRLMYGRRLNHLSFSHPFQDVPSTTGWDGNWPQGRRGEALEWARREDPVGFRNNTESIILMAKGRGMRVVLVNFAFAPQYIEKEFDKFPAGRVAWEKHLKIFEELAARHETPLIHFERNTIPPEHWIDNWCHLDEVGERLKAEMIAGYIAPVIEAGLAGAVPEPGRMD
jgi:hypothetical protein